VPSLKYFCNLRKKFRILLYVLASFYYKRTVNCICNFLDNCDQLVDGLVLTVGISAFQDQCNKVSAFHSSRFLRDVCHSGSSVVVCFDSLRYAFKAHVRNLYADLRAVLWRSVKGVERKCAVSADRHSLVSASDCD